MLVRKDWTIYQVSDVLTMQLASVLFHLERPTEQQLKNVDHLLSVDALAGAYRRELEECHNCRNQRERERNEAEASVAVFKSDNERLRNAIQKASKQLGDNTSSQAVNVMLTIELLAKALEPDNAPQKG